jgi:hypothetical protein
MHDPGADILGYDNQPEIARCGTDRISEFVVGGHIEIEDVVILDPPGGL